MEDLFTVEIVNKELTDPIKVVQRILDSKNKLGASTISELCQLYADKMIEFGIKYDLVHGECIIRSLVTKRSNQLEFPNFGRDGDHTDYRIMRLTESLFRNPSPLVSMASGDLKRQFIGSDLYQKHAPSHLDALFVSDLSKYVKE
jgi:hypothetical protein